MTLRELLPYEDLRHIRRVDDELAYVEVRTNPQGCHTLTAHYDGSWMSDRFFPAGDIWVCLEKEL